MVGGVSVAAAVIVAAGTVVEGASFGEAGVVVAMMLTLDDGISRAAPADDEGVPEGEIGAMAAPDPPPPPAPAVVACGSATYHDSTSVADWNCFAARSAIFVRPAKFPQNIWAVPVEKMAELSGVNADPGDPGETRGAPRAFWTLFHDPRHEDG